MTESPHPVSESRKQFEEWYGAKTPPRFSRTGEYCSDLVESMWCAWQAARAIRSLLDKEANRG
jgi:hypothetical protein